MCLHLIHRHQRVAALVLVYVCGVGGKSTFIGSTALVAVLVALVLIELEVHAGLALFELPAGMMPHEVLAEL